ncbi:MAG: 23S rRNA (adenine(2503)-C(2))-methyltransferase RlmN [Planctomycetaceae bacterium]|nr:23S rRNA (adenine(2503)-C(2))-methyltransferase RlmN [Planctomycetaceae bacterium]
MPDDASSSDQVDTRGLCELTLTELVQWCEAHGQKRFRAKQIWHWLYHKRATSIDEMIDLPSRFRETVASEFQLFRSKIVEHKVASDRTEKLLLELSDGSTVECVLMRETKRRTLCISTQVGCAMGCVFCASGMLGLKRNLSTGEILEQVLQLDRLIEADRRITNVVVMGIGEPLQNLKALLPALDALTEEDGMGLGARRITVSTVGLPKRIRELADYGKQFNLAVSLHAPNDKLRDELVPVNDKIGIDEILNAADYFFETTGRRVTYEYVLLGAKNDDAQHAHQLAAHLKTRNAHVNLIPMNDVEQLPFHAPSLPRTEQFLSILEAAGVPATVRKRKGADIDAACGQLRLNNELTMQPK